MNPTLPVSKMGKKRRRGDRAGEKEGTPKTKKSKSREILFDPSVLASFGDQVRH